MNAPCFAPGRGNCARFFAALPATNLSNRDWDPHDLKAAASASAGRTPPTLGEPYLRDSRWKAKTTFSICQAIQKTPAMQPAVRPPQSMTIFGSLDGTCEFTS